VSSDEPREAALANLHDPPAELGSRQVEGLWIHGFTPPCAISRRASLEEMPNAFASSAGR
jgi:hypothetical protein